MGVDRDGLEDRGAVIVYYDKAAFNDLRDLYGDQGIKMFRAEMHALMDKELDRKIGSGKKD